MVWIWRVDVGIDPYMVTFVVGNGCKNIVYGTHCMRADEHGANGIHIRPYMHISPTGENSAMPMGKALQTFFNNGYTNIYCVAN